MPGPPPKRSEERRRRNKPTTETLKVDLSESLSAEVEVPAPPVDDNGELLWHPMAARWYMSLMESGQAIFYEPSDWTTAYVLAESLSRELNPHDVRTGQREVLDPDNPYDSEGRANKIGQDYTFEKRYETMSAATLTAFLKGAATLMTTEGERRRLRIELDRQKQREAADRDDNVVPISQERENRFKDAR